MIRIKTQGLVDLGILKGDVDKLIEEKAYRQFLYAWFRPLAWLGCARCWPL